MREKPGNFLAGREQLPAILANFGVPILSESSGFTINILAHG